MIAGSASCRFHRPDSGIGINNIAKACIAAARKAEAVIKLWDVEPHMELLGDREMDEAYVAAKPGEQYLLYFTDGGTVYLDLSHLKDRFKLRWINITTGKWGDQSTLNGGTRVAISAPASGGWAAAIKRQ